MTTEEIAVKLEGHEHEIKSLKHRMDDQEEQAKTLNDLAISVKELAINMKSMIDEQKRAGERISKLESEPAERTKVIRNTVVTSIVSTIVGAVASAVIFILTQYLQQF